MSETDERRRVRVGNRNVLVARHKTKLDDLDTVPVRQPPLPPQDQKEKLVRCVVERGRTVHAATGKKKMLGYDPIDGRQIFGPELTAYAPGQELMLPESEAKRLRAAGFVRDETRYASDTEAAKLPPTPQPPPAA